MRRYELTDGECDAIRDLLPDDGGHARGGRRWRDHRQVLNGMLWVLHTGAQWRELPERYGPWQTVYGRFRRWRRDGLLDRVLRRLQVRLDERGRIDWDLFCIDGTNVRASRSAAGARKGGAERLRPGSRTTTRWVAAEAGGARSSTWSLTVAGLRSPRR
jgi:transposase